ncbi:unnamed protein product, partial [Ixodes hexagonus]
LLSERRVRIKRPIFGGSSPAKLPVDEAPQKQLHVSLDVDKQVKDQETAVSSSTPDAEPEAPRDQENLEDFLELEETDPGALDESDLTKTTTDLMTELEDMLQ